MRSETSLDAAVISVVLIPVSTSKLVAADVQRHHDLLERRVARALADAVHGALDLLGAGLDPGERVRDREAEVVVAVHGERHAADLRAAAANVGEEARRTPPAARSRPCRAG